MKGILLRILFLFVGCIIALFVAEGALRILNASPQVRDILNGQKAILLDHLLYSSNLKYTIKPYTSTDCSILQDKAHKATCTVNKLGIRDAEENFAKPANTYRIIVLGDSMTYGLGVNSDQSYPKFLEKFIQERNKSKLKYQVINLGMTFYGPREYKYLYEELGKKFHPDLIIVGFHLLTDPYDAVNSTTNHAYYVYKAIPDEVVPYPANQYLKEHSYLWRAFLAGYYKVVEHQDKDIGNTEFNADKKRFQYETQVNVTSPLMNEAWSLSRQYLDEMIRGGASQGTPTVLVGLPARTAVLPHEWENLKKNGFASDPKLYTDNGSRKQFYKMCQDSHWTCFDVQDALRSAKDLNSVFLGGDIHFSATGNRIVGESIYNFLNEKKYLK